MIATLIGYSSGDIRLDAVLDFIIIMYLLTLMFGFFRSLIMPKKGGL